MGHLRILTGIFAVLVLAVVIELLRRRQLKEKYAILWLVTAVAIIPLGMYPGLLDAVSRSLGIATGASLVLFLAIAFLLFVCMHLSWEVSRLEEETRVLAEEIALINLRRSQPDGGIQGEAGHRG